MELGKPRRSLSCFTLSFLDVSFIKPEHSFSPFLKASLYSVSWVRELVNTDLGSIPRGGKGFFFPKLTFCADSLTVFAQHQCAIACIHICAHLKNPEH